jgi:hypothetical protein
MSLLTSYCQNGLSLLAIPKGMKAPLTLGWNHKENTITHIKQLHLLDDSNVGLAHAYSEPYPTCAVDFDDLIKAKNWFQKNGIEIDLYINADDAVHIVSGKANRLKLLFRLKAGLIPSQVIKEDAKTILEFRCATRKGLTVQDVLPLLSTQKLSNPIPGEAKVIILRFRLFLKKFSPCGSLFLLLIIK